MILMKYRGWTVIDDPMYHRLIKENIDFVNNDVKEMTKIINTYVSNKSVAIDVGCHYGFFTKFLSEQFKTVHAFDFNNDIYKCFVKNMKKFKCKNVIKYPYGLGEKQKYVATNDWSARHGRRAPLGNHINPHGENKNQKIKALDMLNIKDVGLIMIDTEGYELNVLKGAVNTIKKYKPVLVLEFHTTNKNRVNNLTQKYGYYLYELTQYLHELGYKSKGYINIVDQVFVAR
jgi:FkbM family methyltransferase